MVATAGLLGILGCRATGPSIARGPTGLSLVEVPPQDKDLLGRWKPERSDTYARTFAGRVARLHLSEDGQRGRSRQLSAFHQPWNQVCRNLPLIQPS